MVIINRNWIIRILLILSAACFIIFLSSMIGGPDLYQNPVSISFLTLFLFFYLCSILLIINPIKLVRRRKLQKKHGYIREGSDIITQLNEENNFVLFQAEGFFTTGKIKMVQSLDVSYVTINITSKGLEFVGKIGRFPYLVKDSAGYSFKIRWENIMSISKSRERIIHTIKIETKDNFYTIIPLDPLHSGGLNVRSSKRNSLRLFDCLNKARP